MTTFTTAVRKFKKSAEAWLSDEDLPAIVALEKAAESLDEEITPALLAQYGLIYRSLLKKKPAASGEEVDPLDDLIPDS